MVKKSKEGIYTLEEIDLDLKKFPVLGWQQVYCPLIVDAMSMAIKSGQVLPRVDVVLENGIYQIAHGFNPRSSFKNYGGHHRLLAYSRSNEFMPVKLLSGNYETPEELFSIEEMIPREIPYFDRLFEALSFLPKESARGVVSSFCKKHFLDVDTFIGR